MKVKIQAWVDVKEQLSTLNIHDGDLLELTEQELGKLLVDITKRKARHHGHIVNLQVMLKSNDWITAPALNYTLYIDTGFFRQR